MTAKKFSISARECTLIGENAILADANGTQYPAYVIPPYQRPYSWELTEIRRFFQTLFKGYLEEQPCFMGTLQFMPSSTESQGFQIVDGRQRLTTLCLFFHFLKIKFKGLHAKLPIPDKQWLFNTVDRGNEGEALREVLLLDYIPEAKENDTNRYKPRLAWIGMVITELTRSILDTDESKDFDDGLMQYLMNDTYFVVIETQAGLAKTLEIFNTINTAGMDLGTGDLFKIRMFEYLSRIRQPKLRENEAMDAIDDLYADLSKKIDSAVKKYKDRKLGNDMFSITAMMNVLKPILIERAEGNRELHSYGTERFYDELFGRLLLNESNDNFRKGNWTAPLHLDDMHRIIKMRFVWEEILGNRPDIFIWYSMFWETRYSRFHILIFIWLFRFHEEGDENRQDFQNDLHQFISVVVRYYSIMSMAATRILNQGRTETYAAIRKMIGRNDQNSSKGDLLRFWEDRIAFLLSKKEGDGGAYLGGPIFGNWRWSHLMCTYSILVDEENWTWDLYKILWEHPNGLDIEHIHPNNPSWEDPESEFLWNQNGLRNSIGNLTYLERNINRHEVVNYDLKGKWEGYSKSDIPTVKRLIKKSGMHQNRYWTPQMAEERGKEIIKKVAAFLFGK